MDMDGLGPGIKKRDPYIKKTLTYSPCLKHSLGMRETKTWRLGWLAT